MCHQSENGKCSCHVEKKNRKKEKLCSLEHRRQVMFQLKNQVLEMNNPYLD